MRTRAPARTAAFAAFAGIVTLALGTGTAAANGGFAMAVDVRNSTQTVRAEGSRCSWEVSSDVVVVNLRTEAITITAVSSTVSWIAPTDSGVVTDVAVRNTGGLEAGIVLAPDERRTFPSFVVAFSIPCRATEGDLAIRLTSAEGSGSGDAPFLLAGTPVPPGAVGAVALTGGLWLALAWSQRRRRLAVPIPLTLRGDR